MSYLFYLTNHSVQTNQTVGQIESVLNGLYT